MVCSVLLATVALATPTVGSDAGGMASSGPGGCVVLTFVKTQSSEPHVNVYVAKDGAVPPLDDPTPEDVAPYVQSVIDAALEYIATRTMQTSGNADVQVDLVFPRGDDPETDGYRLSVIVDLSNCGPS